MKCTLTAICFFRRHQDTGSTFTGTGSTFTRALVSSRIIPFRLALGSQRALRVLPLIPTHRGLRLEWCRARRNWTTVEGNQVVYSDKSRFNLSSDDNRVRV
ncbi:transposable element Tcb2 transposase [Trichonephila clavipes]|nr:transposable element Tcb2 transposase [Trichonephila clavipes]